MTNDSERCVILSEVVRALCELLSRRTCGCGCSCGCSCFSCCHPRRGSAVEVAVAVAVVCPRSHSDPEPVEEEESLYWLCGCLRCFGGLPLREPLTRHPYPNNPKISSFPNSRAKSRSNLPSPSRASRNAGNRSTHRRTHSTSPF